MKQRSRLWLGLLTVTVVAAASGTAVAGPSSDNLLELAAKGGPSASLGFGISPLHRELIVPLPVIPGSTPAEGRTLGDEEPRGRAVSFDFKLKWPGAEVPIEPYVVIGPALFVEQPHDPSDLMGAPADPIVRLGAKAGAGFNWRLTKDATLFGSYDAFGSARTKAPATGVPTEYELLYGVRFRY